MKKTGSLRFLREFKEGMHPQFGEISNKTARTSKVMELRWFQVEGVARRSDR